MAKVQAIPSGYSSVTPYLVVRDADRAIKYYTECFNASEIMRMAGPGGKIGHAEIRIGDSIVMLCEEMYGNKAPETLGGSPVSIFLYVPDVDATFEQAIKAGGTSEMAPSEMFWGDRFGKLTDPFGHKWAIATHIEDVAPEEMGKRAQAAMAQMSQAATQS